MTKQLKVHKIGDRVVANQTAGFHKGARGEIKFIEAGGVNQRHWVLRDGASSPCYYYAEELNAEEINWPKIDSTQLPLVYPSINAEPWETLGIAKWDYKFLRLAREWATHSKDPSTKVGAALVSPDKLRVALGYNGFPRDMLDLKALYENREEKYSRIIHAEKNAKNNALRMGVMDLTGWTMYTWPFASCDRCFVEIADLGVQRFVAPIVPPEIAPRWEPILSKTRQYAKEMGRDLEEINFPTTFPKELE